MAATKYTGSCGEYYANDSLTANQKKANVIYIGKYLLSKGWSLQAIAGLCGNIESECGFNPGGKEVGGSGYGLIQWTPGSIHSEWCAKNGYSDATTMDANLAHIQDEAENNTLWIKKESYTESYSEFTTSTKSPYYLACAFAWNRERSGVVIWGFHRETTYTQVPPHNNSYCKKSTYDTNCETKCKAWAYCYKTRFGDNKFAAQQERNRQELRDARGGQAENWYKVLWTELYARLDETDTSVLTNKYWKSSRNGRGGLNYNTAIEDWPNAQSGWTNVDKQNIQGTYTTLPNCTSWAWGRVYEIMGTAPPLFTGDAGNWWNSFDTLNKNDALFKLGYTKSQTPTYGAIACWQDPTNPTSMGHVAIVEDIYDDGSISFSESGYTTWSWRPSYFNVQINKQATEAYSHKYTFVGYIGLPKYGEVVTEVAPTINSFTVTEIEAEKATFSIDITENGTAISKVFYTLNDGTTNILAITAGKNTFTIEDLKPNTDYTITVTAEAGTTSTTSNAVMFTTLQSYPGLVKSVTIVSASKKNLETELFRVTVEEPEDWGYWQRIGNDFGYRLFPACDCKLLNGYDFATSDVIRITPEDLGIGHDKNFQICISTWVTDDEGEKIFAELGEMNPVGSNSVCLKELSEMSDNSFLVTDNMINRMQPYIKSKILGTFKPLKVFIKK